MKPLLLILALAFGISAQVPADTEWQFIGQNQSRDGVINLHFAPKTIARNGDKIKVWLQIKIAYGSPFRRAWHGTGPMPDINMLRAFTMFDCKAKTMKTGEGWIYKPSGEIYQEYKHREKVEEESPGTLTWTAFEYFCEKEGKKLTGPPTLK